MHSRQGRLREVLPAQDGRGESEPFYEKFIMDRLGIRRIHEEAQQASGVLLADAEQPAVLGDEHAAKRERAHDEASAIGVVVPLNCRPIIVPSSAPPTVWMKPKTEKATAPSGSMDSEFMLDAAQPKTNCTIINRLKNSQSGMKPAG